MKGKSRVRVQDRNGMDLHDTYYNQAHPKDHSYCKKCNAIYQSKHWFFNKEELKKLKKSPDSQQVICPACQKIMDKYASGIVTLHGTFLKDHREEIVNLIKNEEKKASGRNPLERIIDITPMKGGMEVTTTHEKLAQRIGKRLHSSFSGEVTYRWTPQDKTARVDWVRE